MTLALAYRVKIARSHALYVVGMLGQAYFHGMLGLDTFTDEVNRARLAYNGADASEDALDQLKLATAMLEEIVGDLVRDKTA